MGIFFFLQLALRHLPRLSLAEMVFMSDRCKGLENAVKAMFPNAQHIHCIIHIERNIAPSYGADALAATKAFIYQAAATNESTFNVMMGEIRAASPIVFAYLSKLDAATWT